MSASDPPGREVAPAPAHTITPEHISGAARNVLGRLTEAGFEAYLVGGCVRDILRGLTPKDFDIATAARPEEVRTLFPRCRLIGRRFRLAHVRYGREIIEVATFRARVGPEASDPDGRILRDNVYGTLEEDALRRDFTVNALYYDGNDGPLIDFTGGRSDLVAGLVRTIGDAATRYREDPVRMLRAVRIAAKLGLEIEAGTEAPLFEMASLLDDVPGARLFEEALKLFQTGHGLESFRRLERYDLLRYLYPESAGALHRSPRFRALLERTFSDTDRRIAEGRPVSAGFLVAALMWGPVCERVSALLADERVRRRGAALAEAAEETLAIQAHRTSMPRRFSAMALEVWSMQPRLEHRRPRNVDALLRHPRFRAAYDFLCLRAHAGEPVGARADWWAKAQEGVEVGEVVDPTPSRPRQRRRRSHRRRAAA